MRPAPPGPPPPGVDGVRAVLRYDGAARELVARLKYHNARSSLAWLAGAMAALVPPDLALDAVTFAPTTAARRRARGFDQSELLARAVARRLRVPFRRLLARRPGAPQTGLDAADRRRGPAIALRAPPPAHVLLVDDVLTTGATVSAAAHALRNGGTTFVFVVTAARTPLKIPRSRSDA